MREAMIYQIRVAQDQSAEDITASLAHAAWEALGQVKELRGPDPHRWPELYRGFSKVFKKRLRAYTQCGSLPECRFSLNVFEGKSAGEGAAVIYILSFRGGLLGFVDGLAVLVWRRIRREIGAGKASRARVLEKLQDALQRALAPHLYLNEACARCVARNAVPEQRIWNPSGKASMGGLGFRRSGDGTRGIADDRGD